MLGGHESHRAARTGMIGLDRESVVVAARRGRRRRAACTRSAESGQPETTSGQPETTAAAVGAAEPGGRVTVVDDPNRQGVGFDVRR